jgi:putative transposase
MTLGSDDRRGTHVVPALHAHLLFPTTYPRGVLDTGMLQCCADTTRKACADFGAELRGLNDQDDHVNLLVGYAPKLAISALVNSLMGCRPGGCDRSSPAR